MARFIDFIRHAHAVGPTDPERILDETGIAQARAFGAARKAEETRYGLTIHSGQLRTKQTLDGIANAMGCTPVRMVVTELFDPETPDTFSKTRIKAYGRIGSAPLARYHVNYGAAMQQLGYEAANKLRPIFEACPDDNILVNGHAVYTNQVIASCFGMQLPLAAQKQILDDPCITECSGFRLKFGDSGRLVGFFRFPSITIC